MSGGGVFETETMAELCIKQGHEGEGLAIYRQLVDQATDEITRARRQNRLTELERHWRGSAPLVGDGPIGLAVRRRGEELVVEWMLPAETRAPALQVLLVHRTEAGIETSARTLRLDGPRGSTVLAAPRLHSLRAAAGRLDGERFIPLVRARGDEAPADVL